MVAPAYGKNCIDSFSTAWHCDLIPVAVPTSSLEDRVRILCAQAVAAESEAEFRIVLPQLQIAIRDHISYLRAIAVEAIPEAFRNDANSAD